jgi:uncharacterized membrane protein YfcA
MHGATIFLFANLALGFYNMGTIWAHEIDTFRTWAIIGTGEFHRVQQTHWKKLPYWVFAPVAFGLVGSAVLVRYHPSPSPNWIIGLPLLFQGLSIVLTAILWGPWQAKLSQDPLGSQSPCLAKILKTHWVRTLLVNANAATLLTWVILVSS